MIELSTQSPKSQDPADLMMSDVSLMDKGAVWNLWKLPTSMIAELQASDKGHHSVTEG